MWSILVAQKLEDRTVTISRAPCGCPVPRRDRLRHLSPPQCHADFGTMPHTWRRWPRALFVVLGRSSSVTRTPRVGLWRGRITVLFRILFKIYISPALTAVKLRSDQEQFLEGCDVLHCCQILNT
jgi:hypothetical protein